MPPERGKEGGRGSAEVCYFQRLEKATHRQSQHVYITLTKTTCPALNIEARKENRPRVVVSICTAPPQPARRDFAIAMASREPRRELFRHSKCSAKTTRF
jgi:hypothetical protein